MAKEKENAAETTVADENVEKVVSTAAKSTFKEARKIVVKGEVKSVDNRTVNGNELVFVNLYVTDSNSVKPKTNVSFMAGKKQLDQFTANDEAYAKLTTKGNMVEVELEERIEGVTQFIDANGDVQTHGSSGNALHRMLPLAQSEAQEIIHRSRLNLEHEVKRANMTADAMAQKAAFLAIGVDIDAIPNLIAATFR